MVLRQHYLTGGEALMNDWHQQYLTKQKSMRELHPKHDRTKAWRAVGRLFNPAKPVRSCSLQVAVAKGGTALACGNAWPVRWLPLLELDPAFFLFLMVGLAWVLARTCNVQPAVTENSPLCNCLALG